MPVTLKTNSFKYRDDSSEEWSPALVQATASLEPAFQDIGKLASELGIVVNGNTAAVNIAAGQYIILKNSTISGKEDGLYIAANAVSAGTALQSTDIPDAAISIGGLNALNSDLAITNQNLSSMKLTYFNSFSSIPYSFKGFAAVTYYGVDNDAPDKTSTAWWWNVIQFGETTRLTQVAFCPYRNRNAIYFRHRHDTTITPWVKIQGT